MAQDISDLIGGTVIQRSFVGSGLVEIVNVATVPVSEIAQDYREADSNSSFLRELTGELLGVPANTILDEHQYIKLQRDLTDIPPPIFFRRFPHPYWEDLYHEWRDKLRGRNVDSNQQHPIVLFAEDIVSLMTARGRVSEWPFQLPFDQRYLGKMPEQGMLGNEIDEDAVTAAMACLSARIARTEKVQRFTSALMTYDVPLGQSPSTSSDSLLKLLESGKKMCLAPLAAGGAIGVGQLGSGQYVAALLTVGTGSAMTLVLLGTVAVGTLLVNRVAQQRQINSPRTRNKKA